MIEYNQFVKDYNHVENLISERFEEYCTIKGEEYKPLIGDKLKKHIDYAQFKMKDIDDMEFVEDKILIFCSTYDGCDTDHYTLECPLQVLELDIAFYKSWLVYIKAVEIPNINKIIIAELEKVKANKKFDEKVKKTIQEDVDLTRFKELAKKLNYEIKKK